MSRILLVDDDLQLSLGLKLGLENNGHEVMLAHTVDSCLSIIRTDTFDVILLDIQIEGPYDGFRLAEEIRLMHDIPMIFITGYRDKKTMALARATAAASYVLKPFSVDQIDTTIYLLLRQHALLRSLKENEQLYRIIVEASQEGIIACTRDLIIRMANSRAAELLGRADTDLVGTSLLDHLPASYANEIFQQIRDTDAATSPIVRAIVPHPDSPLPFPSEVSVVAWESGASSQTVLLYLRDTSELLRNDQAIRDTQARLTYALEGSNSGLWDFSIVQRRLYLSREAKSLLGLDGIADEPSVGDFRNFVSIRDIRQIYRAFLDHARGRSALFSGTLSVGGPGHTRRWIRYEGRINERTGDGQPERMTGVVRNITDEKNREDSFKAMLLPELIEQLLVRLRDFYHGNSGAALLTSLQLLARNTPRVLSQGTAGATEGEASLDEAVQRRLLAVVNDFQNSVSGTIRSISELVRASSNSDLDSIIPQHLVARGAELDAACEELATALPMFASAVQPGRTSLGDVQRLGTVITTTATAILTHIRAISESVDAAFTSDLGSALRTFEERAQIQGQPFTMRVNHPDQALNVIIPAEDLVKCLMIVHTNSCEAMTGAHMASGRFEITVSPVADKVYVQCCDTGPGFTPEMLSASIGTLPSTKAPGRGFGMRFILRTLRKFGGTMRLANSSTGTGACVTLTMRRP